MSIEYSDLKQNFEQKKYRETERKFIALDSSTFDRLRPYADRIAQLYLSHPEDEYSLRLRQITHYDGQVEYTAALKDRGSVSESGLDRFEVETVISQAAFRQYFEKDIYPVINKERAKLCEGVTVDWVEGSDTPIVEVENADISQDASDFLAHFSNDLLERTGQSDVDNESIAHALHEGSVERPARITVDEILGDMLAYRSIGSQKLVIGIGGRSGSGKSTLALQLREAIASHPELGETSTLVSTDDYHRGRRYLESTYGAPWTNWEDSRVYNTAELAHDIAKWHDDQPLASRRFDFTTEESIVGESLPASDILIVEGIHASSSDLADYRQMYYEVQTPLAVSLGRDLRRLLDTDRQEAAMRTPEERLRYILEIGELTYRTIEQAPRNKFSASTRSL